MTHRIVTKAFCVLLLVSTAAFAQVERREMGNLRIEGIPEIPPVFTQRMLQYLNTRSAELMDWMPDGEGLLISTRFGETMQLHVVDQPGGARRQITFFDEPVPYASINPDPAANSLVFARDVGGSEFYQLFLYDLAKGTHRMLTDGKSRNVGALWSRAGDRFAYTTTRRNRRDTDVHIMQLDGTSTPAFEQAGIWAPLDWSPDDSRLVVSRYVSINESYPYILNLATGELTPLQDNDPNSGTVSYGNAKFDGKGTGVYFVSDRGSEYQLLRYLDLTTKKETVLTPDINWDVERIELSPDGSVLAFIVNEDGYSRLHLLDTKSGRRHSVDMPMGRISGLKFSPDGRRLGFVLNTPRSPSDVYVLDLATQKLTRWTTSELGGLDGQAFVHPETIRFETFDGRKIPAYFYKPEGSGPFPVVIDIHGGPEAQERPEFNTLIQFLVNELGIAVLTPNVRGSAGYGKSYLLLDNGMKREDSVKDIGALLDWIAARSELDSDRVAVQGGSYGGYMVLASMTHYNDRLRAGVDRVGISNYVTFLERTEEYRRDKRRAEYGDERDAEMRAFLERISPTTNAAKITKPLFVIQGLNDPRVPATESEQMVAEVRKNGGDVWYLLATDEGHGFKKKSNSDYLRAATALFLKSHLLEDVDEAPSDDR